MLNGFRELVVWQKSMDLVELVYRESAAFPREERYGLTIQIRKAAVSIAANIAEGRGRTTRGEYGNFLSIARGSLKEVETLAEIGRRLGVLRAEGNSAIQRLCDEVSRMLTALKRALKS